MKFGILSGLSCLRDENQKTHKMITDLIRHSYFNQTFPKLVPLRPLPPVVTLEDGNDILAWSVKNLTEFAYRWDHCAILTGEMKRLATGLPQVAVRRQELFQSDIPGFPPPHALNVPSYPGTRP